MTICVDRDLIDVVNELKSRRGFSAFIQDCLRSHKTIIEAESLEHENDEINRQINDLISRKKEIQSRLEVVKVEASNEKNMIELESQLRQLNQQKSTLDHWETLPLGKRPKAWHEWNNKRNAVAKQLKDIGFDFTKLRGEN
tara:strand:- start:94 stop:516 length:423 start_codon:yes stop_codon:yes gene_type:complete